MSKIVDNIYIYGATPNITAAQWYNAVCTELLRNGAVPTGLMLESILDPIADYAASVVFTAWAKKADVDIEPELQELLDSAAQNPIKDMPLFESDGVDRNAEDGIFDEDTTLSSFIAHIADRAILSREMSSNGPGNRIIWMLGEKEPGSRPEFKETAYEAFTYSFICEIWFVFERFLKGGEYFTRRLSPYPPPEEED